MDPVVYLKALQRRWAVVAAAVIVALVGGLVTARVTSSSNKGERFQAQVTLVSETASGGGSDREGGSGGGSGGEGGRGGSTQLSSLVTLDAVVNRVAKDIGFRGETQQLARIVQAREDTRTGLFTISVVAPTADRAVTVADSFAKHFLAFLTKREAAAMKAEAATTERQIKGVRAELVRLDRAIAARKRKLGISDTSTTTGSSSGSRSKSSSSGSGSSGSGNNQETGDTQLDLLQADRDAAARTYGDMSNRLQGLKYGVPSSGLEIVQKAVATPVEDSGGGLLTMGAILLIALVIGLLLGVTLALILDRFDTRIRTKDEVEKHVGTAVLAAVPTRPRRPFATKARIKAEARAGESFRLLAAGLLRTNRPAEDGGGDHPWRPSHPQVIMVTSPAPKDGKSTAVALLARAFSEIGKSVLVLSCDFHNPSVHALFGVPNDRGLAEALVSSNGGPVLNGCVKDTDVAGVRLVVSGEKPEHPDRLLSSTNMRRVLAEARRRWDVILLDTTPIFTSSSTLLVPEADAVLVVVRAGRTTAAMAERTGETLRRLEAPTVGIALVGASDATLPPAYYAQDDEKRRGFPRLPRPTKTG